MKLVLKVIVVGKLARIMALSWMSKYTKKKVAGHFARESFSVAHRIAIDPGLGLF